MSISLKMDEGLFARDVRRLSAVLKQDLGKTLKDQAKLFVKDCVLFTPPVLKGGIGESLAAQRRVGDKSVRESIQRAYQPVDSIKILAEESGSNIGKSISKLIRKKRLEEATALSRKAGLRIHGIVQTAGKQYESKRRKGRYRDNGSFIVANGKSIKTLINKKVKRVGIGKHGWATPASRLGLKLPNWITRHAGKSSGTYHDDLRSDSPSITVSNNVPFIQESGKDLRVMAKAMSSRTRNIGKQLESTIKASYKRG